MRVCFGAKVAVAPREKGEYLAVSFSFVNLERSASVHLRTLSICSDGADTQMQRFAINESLKPYSGEALSSAPCTASETPLWDIQHQNQL